MFLRADVETLENDVVRVKELFKADGEGLSDDTVDTIFLPVSVLLSVMTLETSVLISTASKRATNHTETPGQPSDPANNPDVLTRILGHRKEREASKWLKKHFKIPKKTK